MIQMFVWYVHHFYLPNKLLARWNMVPPPCRILDILQRRSLCRQTQHIHHPTEGGKCHETSGAQSWLVSAIEGARGQVTGCILIKEFRELLHAIILVGTRGPLSLKDDHPVANFENSRDERECGLAQEYQEYRVPTYIKELSRKNTDMIYFSRGRQW